MKLPVMPVRSGQDATMNFERLQAELTQVRSSVAIGYRAAVQKIPNNVLTKVALDTALRDPGKNLDLVAGLYRVPVEGYYSVSGSVSLLADKVVNAIQLASIGVNGVEKIRGVREEQTLATTNGVFTNVVAGIVYCAKGDAIELMTLQTSGGELEIGTGSLFPLCVVKVA